MLKIDHAIVAVTDPESWAAQLLDLTGLTAVPGGRHEGTGTGNWIVPLGDAYVELMTVVDRDAAERHALGRWVLEQTRTGDRLAAVCLRTADIVDVATRIDREPEAMSRRTTDGTDLRWRLAGLDAAMSDERLPFYIQWDIDDDQHPGRTSGDQGLSRGGGIRWVEYGGDAQRLADWLGDHALPIRCVDEQPGPRRVAIAAPAGMVHLTTTGIARSPRAPDGPDAD
jgi:hypothetical protein